MSRVKIAHIATVDLSLRYLLLNQMKAIRAAGYDVTGVSAPGPEAAALENEGIRYLALPLTRSLTPLKDLRALFELYRLLRREQFTIVHTHTPKAGLVGQYAALLARVPIRLHTIHGLYFPGHMNPKRRWAYVLLERMTMAFSALNLSQNPEDVSVAIAERICAPEAIEYVGNGIDVRAFDPGRYTDSRRREIRASFGFEPHHVVIGTVARLVVEKGYLELFKAAEILKKADANVRFLFVGEVADFKRDAIRPWLLQEMGIADVAQFVGHRSDIVDMYAAMDIFTLPSHREGFPRAPMEAACMGLPSVATNIRGCRQTVDDGETGYLVPARDAETLAQRLLQLVQNERLRKRIGEAARQKALTEFDESELFRRVLRAYDRLLRAAGLADARPESADDGPEAQRSFT